MNRIKILDAHTINKIAAGEVIERPASVVKELIDNSLDAGATRIIVDLEEGGRGFIRVSDDGRGIAADDLPLALQNHATSKLSSLDDLLRIGSLGFRGEALASIAAVSRFTLTSRQADSDVAYTLESIHGKTSGVRPVAAAVGTSVTAAELFHATPARREFLKSAAAERRAILEVVTTYALMQPALRILIREADQELLDLPAAATLRERIQEILGSRMAANLSDVRAESGPIRVEGLASRPPYGNRNRSQQWVFVNGRPVRDRTVSYAITHAYRHTMERDRFPVVALMLSLPSEHLDVNVHPSKREVRFRDERALHQAVVAALREATGPVSEKDVETLPRPQHATSVFKPFREPPVGDGVEVSQALYERPQTAEPAQPTGELDLFGRHSEDTSEPLETPTRQALTSEESLYWQLHNAYILIQIKAGLVIVDQHAAHERILYDRAVAALETRTASVQRLLFPITLELSVIQYATFEECQELLDKLGFQVQPFGGRCILVEGIPSEMKNWDEGACLLGMLDDLAEQSETKRLPLRDKVLATFSCRAAIMQGQRLSPVEMRALMDELFVTERPYTCPHGRPTLMRVGMDDLDYKFKRTPKSR